MLLRTALFSVILCSLLGCGYEPQRNHGSDVANEAPSGLTQARIVDFDFSDGEQNFTAGFADYPEGQEQFYALQAGIRPLPAALGEARRGYMLSGNNHSDDLIMFLQGPVEQLAAGGTYHASMCVEFASDAPAGSFGVGGSPAESVYVKLGFIEAPVHVDVTDNGYRRIAMDVGSQSMGGRHAQTVGTIAVDTDDGQSGHWQFKRLCTGAADMQATSRDGQAWAFVGFDSGFEATSTVYVTRLELVLQ